MAKNVLITGATGFIGKYVVNEFIRNNGYNITVTDLPGSDFSCFKGIKTAESDIRKQESLNALVKNKELIIHIAGLVNLNADDALLYSINHLGVRNICEAALHEKVKRFIQVSSIGVYGRTENIPTYEDDEKRPKNAYEKSKWLGEQEASKYSPYFDVTVVRPSAVYGLGSSQVAALPMLNMLKHKKLLYLKNGPLLSHVHAEDVARAVSFLAEHPAAAGEAYNLADDRPINGCALVKALAEPLGIEVKGKLPYLKWLFKAAGFAAQKLPKSFYRHITKRLQNKWAKFQEENKLRSGLTPELSPVWFDYLTANKVFSNEKIKKLGFKFKHNDAAKGIKEVVKHYIDNNYLTKR